MSDFTESQHPRINDGTFTEKQHSSPEVALSPGHGELLVWAVEGDDHEVRLVEATSVDEALEIAAAEFSSQYDEEYDQDLLQVAGAFRGDLDDTDSLVFVSVESISDERVARRALNNVT